MAIAAKLVWGSGVALGVKLPHGDGDEWRKFPREGRLCFEPSRDPGGELLAPPALQELAGEGWVDDAEACGDPIDLLSAAATAPRMSLRRLREPKGPRLL
jgi:hypothetical protein